jgi:chaperonin GroEL (HSP60 family)
LQDIARLTGARAITEGLDVPLKDMLISGLGQAERITVDKNHTAIEGRDRPGWPSCESTLRLPEVCSSSIGSSTSSLLLV